MKTPADSSVQGKDGMLLIITGPPASGKDTVMKALLDEHDLNLSRIVTYATREIRSEEKNGVDYHFVSEEEFHYLRKKGHFIEHVKTGTTWKATPKEPFLNVVRQNHRCIWRIDPFRSARSKSLFIRQFGKETGEQLYNKTVTIFINVNDKEILKNRFLSRKKYEDIVQFEMRFEKDMKVFEKLKHKYDFVVDNSGDVNKTIKEIKEIIANFKGV